jgi:hypothetical protein
MGGNEARKPGVIQRVRADARKVRPPSPARGDFKVADMVRVCAGVGVATGWLLGMGVAVASWTLPRTTLLLPELIRVVEFMEISGGIEVRVVRATDPARGPPFPTTNPKVKMPVPFFVRFGVRRCLGCKPNER